MKAKTLFITISRGGIARNLLKNDFYDLVKKNYSQIYLLTPAYQDKRFQDEFAATNVEMLPLLEAKYGILDRFFSRFNSYIIYNKNTIRLSLYDYIGERSAFTMFFKYIKHFLLKLFFLPLSKAKVIRKFFRYVDVRISQRNTVVQYEELIKKYKPDLIFSTSIVEESEIALLKAAKKQSVPTVAMAKSWDNPSKRYFRVQADTFVVWSSFMKNQMQHLQDYKEQDVFMVGVPQFDCYFDKSKLWTREKFCSVMGLDPQKKIILLTSEGKLMPSDVDIAQIVYDFIKDKKLRDNCQLLIRPHYAYRDDDKKFVKLEHSENVIIDRFNNPSVCFRDAWDYSDEFMDRFVNTLHHADVIMNTCSTITLDAIAMGKPVILIKFDGYQKKPFYKSAARWYVCDYYDKILQFKAGIEVENVDELNKAVNLLLEDSSSRSKEREDLLLHFCYQVDSQSGKRLFQALDKILDSHKLKSILK